MSTNLPPYGLDYCPVNDDEEISDAPGPFILPHPTRDSPSPIDDAQSIRASTIALSQQICFLMTSVEALQEQRIDPTFVATHTTPAFIPHGANIPENITSSLPHETPTSNQATNSSTISHIIGDFLPEEQGAVELEFDSMQVISREELSRLNASDNGKVYFSFIKGINSKFKAIRTIVGLENISTISNISAFAEQRLEIRAW
jgi:hypothetical protein